MGKEKEKIFSRTETEIIELRKLIRRAQEFLQMTRHNWNGPIHRAAFQLQKAIARKIPFDFDEQFVVDRTAEFNQHVSTCPYCKVYDYTKCAVGTEYVELQKLT